MIKKEGIILNLMDYQESHKILYILTNTGVQSLLVRRAKRFNSGIMNYAQKVTKVSFIDNEKQLASTNEISLIDNYDEIKEDIDSMMLCEYITEVLYKITLDNINFEVLYKMINALLEEIKIRNDYNLLFIQFKIKMFYFFGILPSFKQCRCGSEEVIGLSISNGAECITHKSSDNIGDSATKIIYLLYKDQFTIKQIDKQVILLLNDFIEKYYNKHFYMEFKSEKTIKNLLLK